MVIIAAGILSLWVSFTFPKESVYINLPKKYLLQAVALFLLGFSIFFTGFMAVIWNMQTQWYYAGALLAGIIEFISLHIPPRTIALENKLKQK
ncbi:hypothetical protein ACFL4O_04105 [bacterium]